MSYQLNTKEPKLKLKSEPELVQVPVLDSELVQNLEQEQELELDSEQELVLDSEQELVLDSEQVQELELELDLEQVLLDLELVKLFHQLVSIKKLMEVQLLDHQLLEAAYYQL